jgi:hypothetical protein
MYLTILFSHSVKISSVLQKAMLHNAHAISDYVFLKCSHRHQFLKSLVAKMKPGATETNTKISTMFPCNVMYCDNAKKTAKWHELNKGTSAMIKPYLLYFPVLLLLFCCPTMLQASIQPLNFLMLGLLKQLPSHV